jgi:hypothetical protein
LFSQKEKHLKQGEKISNLDNASQNLIHLPLTICKRTLKNNLQKNLQKQNMWCKRGKKELCTSILALVCVGINHQKGGD